MSEIPVIKRICARYIGPHGRPHLRRRLQRYDPQMPIETGGSRGSNHSFSRWQHIQSVFVFAFPKTQMSPRQMAAIKGAATR
jgi:hypothetical protein